MIHSAKKPGERLNIFEETFDVLAEKPKLAEGLLVLGYPQENLNTGRGLLTKAFTSYRQQMVDEKTGAVLEYKAVKNQISKSYTLHVLYGRILFKNQKPYYDLLDLRGTRATIYDDFKTQTRTFCQTVLNTENILAAYATRNILVDEFTNNLALIEVLDKLHGNKNVEIQEAIAATTQRDADMEAIDEWFDELAGYARAFYVDDEQYLKKINLL